MFTQHWTTVDEGIYAAMTDGFYDALAMKDRARPTDHYYCQGFSFAKEGLAAGLYCWMVDESDRLEPEAEDERHIPYVFPEDCEF